MSSTSAKRRTHRPVGKTGHPARLHADVQTPAQALLSLLEELQPLLAQHLSRLQSHKDPDALHQARVTLRRMRAAQKAFSVIALQSDWQPFLRLARRLARRLGKIRDLDVLLESTLPRLDPVAAPATTPLRVLLQHYRTRLFRSLCREINAGNYQSLLQGTPPIASGANPDLQAFATQALERRQRRVARLARIARGFRTCHALRKRVKELRYAVEFFSALYPRETVNPYMKKLRAAQDALGALVDCHAGNQLLQKIPGRHKALKGSLAPLVKALKVARIGARKRLAPHLNALQDPHQFWDTLSH